jgi:hypothetical protein
MVMLGVCTAMLTLVGPGGVSSVRAEAPCEGEAKSQIPGSEHVESVTILRFSERTQVQNTRRSLSVPTGSCAGDRAFSFAHHSSPRPIAAEHADRNGFGGPLRR